MRFMLYIVISNCSVYCCLAYNKAKSGATISGTRLRGSGTISSTYEKMATPGANIDDIHGDWKVSACDFTGLFSDCKKLVLVELLVVEGL